MKRLFCIICILALLLIPARAEELSSDPLAPSYYARIEYEQTLGIVQLNQTVKVFNYFYDRIAKKYSVPMETIVTNKGMDAWVRVYLNAFRTVRATGELEPIDYDLVEVGLLDTQGEFLETTLNYIIRDNCLYLTQILPTSYSIYIDYYGRFNSYQHLYSSSYISTTPSSEAIQSLNFYPDFSTTDPWFNTIIQDQNIDSVQYTGKLEIVVEIDDNISTIDADATRNEEEEDFTSAAMPGDDIDIPVNLTVGQDAEIFHKVSLDAALEDLRQFMLNSLQVFLTANEQTTEVPVEENFNSVGEYTAGTILQFLYKLKVNAELDNQFIGEKFKLIGEYLFVTPTPTPTPTPSPTPTPTPTASPSPTPTITPEITNRPTPTATTTNTPTPSPTPEVTITPKPTDTPPRPIPNTPTPTPEVTASSTPTPTLTPKMTETPTKTPTAAPTKIPKQPGIPVYIFNNYDTPLGVIVPINHVGDCFE